MKVGVALSGGKDSSLVAALLKKDGFDVIGFHLLLCPEKYSTIPVSKHLEAVHHLSRLLNINLEIIDLRNRFQEEIIKRFIEDYNNGLTPNPCVRCNRIFKFGALLESARAAGCEKLASGHYARVSGKGDKYFLKKSAPSICDESYFLGQLPRSVLPWLTFPLGERSKKENIRLLSELLPEYHPLPVSREACFLGEGGLKDFTGLKRIKRGKKEAVEIIDEAGEKLGEAPSDRYYTVGQRRGLGPVSGGRGPIYVLKILPRENQVVIGPKANLFSRFCRAEGANWLGEIPQDTIRADVKIRYTHPAAPALISRRGEGKVEIRFEEDQMALTPGQLAVFYRKEILLGSAWIKEIL